METRGTKRRKRKLAQMQNEEQLIAVAGANDIQRVRALLLEGQNLDQRTSSKDRALRAAISQGFVAVARCLIDEGGANIPADTPSPLHCACKNGHFDMAVFLAEQGGQEAVDALDADGCPPHMTALRHKWLRIVQHILSTFEIDLNRFYQTAPHCRVSALEDAIDRNDEKTVAFLLKHGANPNIQTPGGFALYLHCACVWRRINLKILSALTQNGADVNAQDSRKRTPLIQACRSGLPEGAVRILLEAGAKIHAIDYQGNNALIMATCVEVAQLLLENGATVPSNPQGTKALLSACSRGSWDLVRLLVSNGANVNGSGAGFESVRSITPLMKACCDRKCPPDVVSLLLGTETNMNALNHCGQSALHLTAMRGNTSAGRILLENGAELNALGGNGDTALHTAFHSHKSSFVKMLLEGGADVNLQDKNNGWTVLHFVCRNSSCSDSVSEVDSLLKRGANVNILDKNGNTPLLLALRRWCDGKKYRQTVVRRLLAAGADLHHHNMFGDNALSTAAVFPFYGDKDACQFVMGLEDEVLSKQGGQALMAAGLADKENIVRLLVQALSERGILNADGMAAVPSCEQQNHGCEYAGGIGAEAWSDQEQPEYCEYYGDIDNCYGEYDY